MNNTVCNSTISEKDVLSKMVEMRSVAGLRTADLEDNYNFVGADDMPKVIKRKVFSCEMVLMETSDGKKFFTFEYESADEKKDDNGIWRNADKSYCHQGTYKVE